MPGLIARYQLQLQRSIFHMTCSLCAMWKTLNCYTINSSTLWSLAISRKRKKNWKPTKELKIAAILEQLKIQECKSVTLASHQPVFLLSISISNDQHFIHVCCLLTSSCAEKISTIGFGEAFLVGFSNVTLYCTFVSSLATLELVIWMIKLLTTKFAGCHWILLLSGLITLHILYQFSRKAVN